MTTSVPHPSPDYQPGTMIASLPAVLGFVPEHSVVLVTFERREVACVMRADLSDDVLDSVFHMVDVVAMSRPDMAVLVIVDEQGATCRMCLDDHRQLSGAVRKALDDCGVTLWGAHVVDRVAAGGHWQCVDGCGNKGTVDDPASSPHTAAAVWAGRRMYANRGELLDVVTGTDHARAETLREAIEAAAHEGGTRPAAAARRDVEHALAVAAAFADGELVTDGDLARLACALDDPRVRDTMYALAVGDAAAEAEALWAMLSRALPAPWRAEALVLLAFSAYVRADGPVAGVALEAALRDHPTHRMAGMLDQALQSGMRPDQIRELARTGYRLAKRIGVQLPPRRILPR